MASGATAVLLEAAQDDAYELARVLATVAAVGREPHAQGRREAFEIFDPGFVQAVGGELHARAG